MRHLIRATVVAIVTTAGVLSTRGLHAQQAAAAPETDAHWYGWLGCWAPDSATAARGGSRGITCVVPSKSSRGVDALTILRGKITQRNHLDANGRARAIDGQGCKGSETANWSAAGRRLYLHSDYTCAGGIAGSSSTISALTPEGEWLRVERVRSGSGAVVTVDRLHEIDPPAVISAEAIRSIEDQQRTITTARASAALLIGADEIVDAVRVLDAEVVRAWLVASEQTFDFGATQLAALALAGVPATVIDVVGAPIMQLQPVQEPPRTTVVYASEPTYPQNDYSPGGMQCPPNGCYSPYSPYSTYNGYGYNPTYPYGYGYLPSFYTLPVVVRNNVNRDGKGVNRGKNNGSNHWDNDNKGWNNNNGGNRGSNSGQNGGNRGSGSRPQNGGNRGQGSGPQNGGNRGPNSPPQRGINSANTSGPERYQPPAKAIAPKPTSTSTSAPVARRRG